MLLFTYPVLNQHTLDFPETLKRLTQIFEWVFVHAPGLKSINNRLIETSTGLTMHHFNGTLFTNPVFNQRFYSFITKNKHATIIYPVLNQLCGVFKRD